MTPSTAHVAPRPTTHPVPVPRPAPARDPRSRPTGTTPTGRTGETTGDGAAHDRASRQPSGLARLPAEWVARLMR